jgi:hypothetical protein
MAFLTEKELDALRAIAERLRDQDGDEVVYGAYRGGNPNDFCPDCSTDEQLAAHQEACKRWDAGERNLLPAECSMTRAAFGADAKFNDFGLGTYTLRRSDVDELADELDRWLDKVREVEGRYL